MHDCDRLPPPSILVHEARSRTRSLQTHISFTENILSEMKATYNCKKKGEDGGMKVYMYMYMYVIGSGMKAVGRAEETSPPLAHTSRVSANS